MSYKGISHFDVSSESPFGRLRSVNVYYKGSKPIHTGKYIVDKESGESMPITTKTFGGLEISDSMEYLKLYKYGLTNLRNVNGSGMNILFFIFDYLLSGQDWIELNDDVLLVYCGYKNKKNVKEGIVNLLENGILGRRKQGGYWVNPNFVFRGDRRKLLVTRTEEYGMLCNAITERFKVKLEEGEDNKEDNEENNEQDGE